MKKPMIMFLLEDLRLGGAENIEQCTDLDSGQVVTLIDEMLLLEEGPGGTRNSSVERGRIFAGMSGITAPNHRAVSSVVADMLHWLDHEGGSGDVNAALMNGYAEYLQTR